MQQFRGTTLRQSLQDPARIRESGMLTYRGWRVPLRAMQYRAREGVQHKGSGGSPWRYIFSKLENRIQRPVKDTAEEMKEPLRIKMENFQETENKKVI